MSTHTDNETLPRIATRDEWQAAALELRAREKEATRARDALAAARRRLPMLRVDGHYEFEGPDGPATLLDLFDGRRQLIVYHFMWNQGDDGPCTGCCMFVDNLGHPAHLCTLRRGVEALGSVWTLLDLTPLGRQETWEDSPAGYPQTPPYEWWRIHDEYDG